MALKDLSAEAMIFASNKWLDPKGLYLELDAVPGLHDALELMKEAHERLCTLHDEPTQDVSDQLEHLSRALLALDRVHDERGRVLHDALELIEYAHPPTSERGMQAASLRRFLFPDGLTINKLTYLEEAANIEQVRDTLTSEHRDQLASFTLDTIPLIGLLDEWLEVGEKLGEAYRARREVRRQSEGVSLSADDLRQARHAWVRTARLLLDTLELAGTPDALAARVHEVAEYAQNHF